MQTRSIDETEPEVMSRPDMEGLHIRELINEQTVNSREVTLDIGEIPPGKTHVLHRHTNCEEVIYVLKGSIQCLSETGTVRLGEGEAMFVEQGEWHGVTNDSDAPTTLLVVYGGAPSLEAAGYELYPGGEDES